MEVSRSVINDGEPDFEAVTHFANIPTLGQKAYASANYRAAKKGLPLLSKKEFVEIWNRSSGRCELSGIEFSNVPEVVGHETNFKRSGSFPWQPSLDQIKPSLGYYAANCQLVCKAVNLGKNGYSQETFLHWVRAIATKQKF